MGRGFGKQRRGRTFQERRRGRGFQDPPDDLFLAEAWSTAEDAVLCHAANEGVAAGFDALYARYRTWVVRMALALAASEDDARALFQDVFQLWFSQFPTPPSPSVRADLYALLRKRVATLRASRSKVVSLEAYRRRRRGRSGQHSERSSQVCQPPKAHRFSNLPGLAAVPGDLLEVALLRAGAGFQASEIARALELPLETVRLRLNALTEHILGAEPAPSGHTVFGLDEAGVDADRKATDPRATFGARADSAGHLQAWEIEAAVHRDAVVPGLPGGAARGLDDVLRHLDVCLRCQTVHARIAQFVEACELPAPIEIPEDMDRAVLLEGHLRAAAIVRRVVEAVPGGSLSSYEALEEAEVGDIGGEWTAPKAGNDDSGLEASPDLARVVELSSGHTWTSPHRRLVALTAFILLLIGAVVVVGQRWSGEQENDGTPSWHEKGAESSWQSSD